MKNKKLKEYLLFCKVLSYFSPLYIYQAIETQYTGRYFMRWLKIGSDNAQFVSILFSLLSILGFVGYYGLFYEKLIRNRKTIVALIIVLNPLIYYMIGLWFIVPLLMKFWFFKFLFVPFAILGIAILVPYYRIIESVFKVEVDPLFRKHKRKDY